MAIIFLGTSNCILGHSFVHTVRALADEEVINASIGASPCDVGLYILPDVKLSPGDVAFLDYTITDEASVASGLRSDEELNQLFATLIAKLHVAGVLPILLLNPTKVALHGSVPTEDLHLKLCIELGVPIFSVSDLLRLAFSRGCSEEDLMIDPAHQSAAVTPTIGVAMMDAVAAVRAMGPTVRMADVPIWSVRRIVAAPLVAPERRKFKSSSLRSADLAFIGMDEEIYFDVDEDEAILGFFLNAGAKGANIRLSGDQQIITSLLTSHDNRNPDAYMLMFIETRTRIFGGERGVKLELMPADVPVTEFTTVNRTTDEDIYGEIQLDGVLVGRQDVASFNADHPIPPKIDLLDRLREQLCDQIIAAVTPAVEIAVN